MNVDELINSIPDTESSLRNDLATCVNRWKKSTDDVYDLEYLIDKWHGNVWFKNKDVSNQFYKTFSAFRDEAIKQIGGMTMNERLWRFSLFELWDQDQKNRGVIESKLKSK